MSQHDQSDSPPPGSTGNSGTGVRRHHTISAASRTARPSSKIQVSEADDDEQEQVWAQDDVVDQDWRGGIGAVGEKSSLHRQASLPTKYHRAFGGPGTRKAGNHNSMTHNSLTAIAGANEGDEEEWETDLRGLRNEEEHVLATSDNGHGDSGAASPHTPQQFSTGIPPGPSPPPTAAAGAAGVRRHQSLNYPNAAGVRRLNAGLKRAGTLQAPPIKGPAPQGIYSGAQSPSPTGAEEEYDYDYDNDSVRAEEDGYFRAVTQQQGQSQYPTSPMGRSSPWSTPGSQHDWRTQLGGNVPSNIGASVGGIDDVSRAITALEINQQYGGNAGSNYQQGIQYGDTVRTGASRKLQLVTDVEGQLQQGVVQSAAAYVPPIGHSVSQNSQRQGDDQHSHRERAFTTSGSTPWDQKERFVGGKLSNTNLQHLYQSKNGGPNIPGVPSIPAQYLNNNQGQGPRMGLSQPSGSTSSQHGGRGSSQGSNQSPPSDNFLASPIDVPTLIATKGYNPAEFDCRPLFARYFVIKSYTEDDVHKSLKYEIWSSTDPGNKRLDKAFKENAGRGPIYLFFSVNASGHFCGMAEMLTPVDYTRSSTVWASDKWKGVFKVRWVFVRDIPNAGLRHIRLQNTQERKPVTNSRDTQELLPEAGQEMLRIFHTHPARTSLLQDFAFYELQAMQKVQAQLTSGTSSPDQSASSIASPVLNAASTTQHPFAMSNPAALAYAAQMGMPQMNQMNQMSQMNLMNPMLQMQMNLNNMNNMNAAFANPHTMQSVLRQQSPSPMGSQNYMSMGGMPGF